MDLLRNAYSTASDEDDDKSGHVERPALPPSKRPKPGNPSTSFKSFPVTRPNYAPNHPNETPLPGRYISKRERAVLASPPPTDPNALLIISSPALGNISDSDIQHDILSSLRHQRKGHTLFSQLPERLSVSLTGHDKAVNALQWSTTHPFSSSSCICWNGSHYLYMECVEQKSEKGTSVEQSYRGS